jgi:SAM-dependent methyltransferase
MKPWHDDDAFWEKLSSAMFSEKRLAGTGREVDGVLRLLDLEPGARVLDLCCGGGRHALELVRRGFAVTGVDRTAAYLERAESIARSEKLAIELVRADMREFERPNAFDAALNLFTSFGFFDDPADDERVARHLFESLRPGGRLVMDIAGKEVLARNFRPRDWSRLDDGSLFLEERKLEPGYSAVTSTWILITATERFEHDLHIRLYSGMELAALLRSVGFIEVDLFGSLQATPYDTSAERLVARARRS